MSVRVSAFIITIYRFIILCTFNCMNWFDLYLIIEQTFLVRQTHVEHVSVQVEPNKGDISGTIVKMHKLFQF